MTFNPPNFNVLTILAGDGVQLCGPYTSCYWLVSVVVCAIGGGETSRILTRHTLPLQFAADGFKLEQLQSCLARFGILCETVCFGLTVRDIPLRKEGHCQ